MHLGVVSTSWPSSGRPWAGHFVRDLARELAVSGARVTVLAPQWSGHGGLLEEDELTCVEVPMRGTPGSLADDPLSGLQALARLRRAAAALQVDGWLCHWWPTRFVITDDRPCLVVLHGSDVDLLARLPRRLRASLGARMSCVAVAEHVARRFAHLTGQSTPPVCPLGAQTAVGEPASLPPRAAQWLASEGHRVLTVARDAPGKGWRSVEGARRLLPGLSWLGLKPEDGVGPEGVRQLIAKADLVVVPSENGTGQPTEGRPHIIAQALVAGVPVLGGPNAAVREAMADLGQQQVSEVGAQPLADGVRRVLEPRRYRLLQDRAREAGRSLEWSVLGQRWSALIREAHRSPGHQTRSGSPSC